MNWSEQYCRETRKIRVSPCTSGKLYLVYMDPSVTFSLLFGVFWSLAY